MDAAMEAEKLSETEGTKPKPTRHRRRKGRKGKKADGDDEDKDDGDFEDTEEDGDSDDSLEASELVPNAEVRISLSYCKSVPQPPPFSCLPVYYYLKPSHKWLQS